MKKHSTQLHLRVSPDELDRAKALACTLSLTVSDLVRVLVQLPASALAPGAHTTLVVVDTATAAHIAREMRRWGYHYNQSVHALNSIAYYLRLHEADATDALEVLDDVAGRIDCLNSGVCALRDEVHVITSHVIARR